MLVIANDRDSARADDCVCLRTLINDGLASGRSDSGRRGLLAIVISACSTKLNRIALRKAKGGVAGWMRVADGPVSRAHLVLLPPDLVSAREGQE